MLKDVRTNKGYRVTVKPDGNTFVVHDSETILDAALRCGYFFPHHCRMGVCATCKGKLIQGEIDYAGAEILGITHAEQQEGYALFCCARPKSNLIIHVDDVVSVKMASPIVLTYQVIWHALLAKDITQIILKSPANEHIHYQAGQYITILHHDQSESPMSIACAPFDLSVIELHLYHPPENTQALDMLAMVKHEKQLQVKGPYGICTASNITLDRPLIFLANGTGFAPIKAVMEELLQLKDLPFIHLYWCAEGLAEIYLNDLVKSWEIDLNHFRFTKTDAQSMIKTVQHDYPDLTHYQVYAVESPEAVSLALTEFMKNGLMKDYFYSDVL